MASTFIKGINKKNLKEAYLHLSSVLASERFLSNQGLNNEVPFHICPYSPAIQDDMNQLIKQLANYLNDANVRVLEINLYDMAIALLKADGDFQWLMDNETTMSRAELKEELQGILDIETAITPAIAESMKNQEFDILMLTGVSEVFPYIRSHNILNNLQKIAKDKPTLMFFPGEYQYSLENGTSLVLFGKLEDDKYYRAFNILDRAI